MAVSENAFSEADFSESGSPAPAGIGCSLFPHEPEHGPSQATTPPDDGDAEVDPRLAGHLRLLERRREADDMNEIQNAPVFTERARKLAAHVAARSPGRHPFSQYGLIACDSGDAGDSEPASDSRIYYNVSVPSSVFVCGSQGSGKSYTLSCLLENCLIPSDAAELPHPLTGIVFHYDNFVSDHSGAPCEAAYLSSNKAVSVRVLCAPTSIHTAKVREAMSSERPMLTPVF